MNTSNFWLVCLLAATTNLAHATADLQIIQCSGSIQRIDLPNIIYSCEGDLLLSTGRISSDTDITISATKSLTLQNAILEGVNITLISDSITLGSDTKFSVQNALLVNSYSSNALPILNIAQDNSLSSTENASNSLVASQNGTGYSFSNLSSSAGAVVVSMPAQVSTAPTEEEGGGSTSAAFLLGLAAAILLLKISRAA